MSALEVAAHEAAGTTELPGHCPSSRMAALLFHRLRPGRLETNTGNYAVGLKMAARLFTLRARQQASMHSGGYRCPTITSQSPCCTTDLTICAARYRLTADGSRTRPTSQAEMRSTCKHFRTRRAVGKEVADFIPLRSLAKMEARWQGAFSFWMANGSWSR